MFEVEAEFLSPTKLRCNNLPLLNETAVYTVKVALDGVHFSLTVRQRCRNVTHVVHTGHTNRFTVFFMGHPVECIMTFLLTILPIVDTLFAFLHSCVAIHFRSHRVLQGLFRDAKRRQCSNQRQCHIPSPGRGRFLPAHIRESGYPLGLCGRQPW